MRRGMRVEGSYDMVMFERVQISFFSAIRVIDRFREYACCVLASEHTWQGVLLWISLDTRKLWSCDTHGASRRFYS